MVCSNFMAQKKQLFEVKVGDFSQLAVIDNINVVYACSPDSAGMAVFSCSPAIANQLMFTNNQKGKLSINVGTDSVNSPSLPTLKLYSTFLREAVNDGTCTLTIEKIAPAPDLKFKLSDNGCVIVNDAKSTNLELAIVTGKGKISASGECTNLTVRNMGTGIVQAEQVKTVNANCRILGTGKVYCNINGGRLTIKGSGTGKVFYHGLPSEIKSLQLGSIKAISLDSTK